MKCVQCQGAAQLYLCGRCTARLKEMLTALAHGELRANGECVPGWLEHLAEAAVGQTRMGEMARWFRAAHAPLRFDSRASDQLTYVHSVLVEWVRDLCETRGVQTPMLHTTSEVALWLAANASAIAADQGAAVCYREISELTKDIERLIDRPIPRRFCGPCPSELDRSHDANCDKVHPHACGVALTAQREASEVTCPMCKQTHDIAELWAQLLSQLDDWTFPYGELVTVLSWLDERVPPRTLREWLSKGKLTPVDHRMGKAVYRLGDVRRLRAEKPQGNRTGAAAHKAKYAVQ